MTTVPFRRKITTTINLLLVTIILAGITIPSVAIANVTNPEPKGKVSFTFDDGYESFITKAAPTLAQYGMSGTAYMTTDFIGQQNYMSWEQTTRLQNDFGWEIGSHSVTHPLMTEINDAQLEYEVSQSKLALQQHGFNPTSFATPFGDYNDKVVAAIAKYYTNHRPFHDIELPNTWPYKDYILQVKQVQSGVSVQQVQQYIDDAKANNTWLILVFHDIKDNASTNPEDYEYKTSDLGQIASYVKNNNVATANISESLVTVDEDKLPNNSFENGLGEGWATNTPGSVLANDQNHGSYPESEHSIKMIADNDKNVHLFSPKADVSKDKTYVIKSYVNIVAIGSGEVALYIDEYDANGNWVSGQYKGSISSSETKNINVVYNPTAANVAQASLQFIVTAGSGITAYVDNVEWFSTTPESPAENPDPENPSTNEYANSSFDNGLADGWTTDSPTNVTADNQNHGSPSSPQHSIKFAATDKNIHLFSPTMTVEAAKSYRIKYFLDIMNIQDGEVAFYVDEYDTNSNWVSGQYLSNSRVAGAGNGGITYVPTSGNVAKAKLQVIVTANSGITAYLDDVEWHTNTTPPNNPPEGNPDPTPESPEEELGNLFDDASFDSGLTGGWSTDNTTTITADSSYNGSPTNPQYAIKLLSGDRNNHLFSRAVNVNPVKHYSIGAYLNIVNIQDGEVAFYVDEYDTNGNWVSGQYVYAVHEAGVKNVQFSYSPSSAQVSKAKLQVIVTANSGITAYLDDVTLQLLGS